MDIINLEILQSKRCSHLVDLKEMAGKQLVQESKLARKAYATQKSFSYELGPRGGIRLMQPRARSFSDLKVLSLLFGTLGIAFLLQTCSTDKHFLWKCSFYLLLDF